MKALLEIFLAGGLRWDAATDQALVGHAEAILRQGQTDRKFRGFDPRAMGAALPVDLVPALGTALYAGTSAVIIVVTNVYYVTAGVYDRSSTMYGPTETASQN